MKHHYAIESCTQETLYYYYAVDMKVNGLKCSRTQTSGNSLDSQAIGPQIRNPRPPDPSLVLFSVTPLIRAVLMYAHSGRKIQFF